MSNEKIYAVSFIVASSDVTVEQFGRIKMVAAGQTDQVLWEKWSDNARDAICLARKEILSCQVTGAGTWLIVAVDSETEDELECAEIIF